MKFDNTKNHLYYFFAPRFLQKKLTIQEIFMQQRRLSRFDRARIITWEAWWRWGNFGTYVGTGVVCWHLIANTDMMIRYGPSYAVARVGVVAAACIVLSDICKVAYFYDNHVDYVKSLLERNDIEVYNPFTLE